MSVLPPQMFTAGNVTPPESLYEQLAVEFPQYVRKDEDGRWEIDIWLEPGLFSPAVKELYARTAAMSREDHS